MRLILSEFLSLDSLAFNFPLNACIKEIPLKEARELAECWSHRSVWLMDEQHTADLFSHQLGIPIGEYHPKVPVVEDGDKMIVGMVLEQSSPRFPRESNQLSCSVTSVVRWFEVAISAQESKS